MRDRARARRRTVLLAAGAGAAAAYFFDPQMGRTRRTKARDKLGAAARRASRRLGRLGRRTGASGYGAWMKATHHVQQPKDLDEAALTHKVESEVLRGPSVPEGISVNVEDGVVVLRGQVDSPERMTELTAAVLRVQGVTGVENLLHLPGEPAPNKAKALEASRAAELS
jgi:osmotically-inducible protein OsmY